MGPAPEPQRNLRKVFIIGATAVGERIEKDCCMKRREKASLEPNFYVFPSIRGRK
jgi:hypothetical protein